VTGTGAYLAVFLLMTLAFIGIPAVGPAVVGWAAVLASQGELNIVLVLIVAGCAMLAARYYRRRRARRFAGKASTGKASTGKASIGKAGG